MIQEWIGSSDARIAIDPIEHLAKALAFENWRERSFVVASTVYADASGQLNTEPCYLIGGWFHSANAWTEFAVAWKAFLHRHGLSYLHQTGKPNKKTNYWQKDEILRKRINSEAFDIIERSGAVSFVHFTPDDDYRRFFQELPSEMQDLDPFVFNALRFVADVTGWCKRRNIPEPEFVFEAMDDKTKHDGLVEVMRRYDMPDPIFRAKLHEDSNRAVVALQAADFLAYEVFRGWKDLVNKGHSERIFLLSFDKMIDRKHWAWADYAKLKALVPLSQVQRHLEKIARGESSVLDFAAWWARDMDR